MIQSSQLLGCGLLVISDAMIDHVANFLESYSGFPILNKLSRLPTEPFENMIQVSF
jgi:hypothetical protein